MKQKEAFAYILLVFSPIVGLFFAVRNLGDKAKLLFLTLFGTIYGLTINYIEGNDAWTHAHNLESYYNLDLNEFIKRLVDIITLNPSPHTPSDLYIHFLNGIAGSIFQSPVILFGIVGTVYGYFYGNALIKILRVKKETKITLITFILISLFITYRSFDNMQTIRSWTGMWVLFNGVLGYYQTKNKKYILLIFLTPLFHLMYSFIALPALLLLLFKTPPRKVIIGIYLISFVTNINTLSVVNLASENELAERKLSSYYRIGEDGEEIDPIKLRKEGSNAVWYAKYGKSVVVHIATNYFLLLFIITGFYSKQFLNKLEYELFSVGMLTAALSNFLSFSASIGGRTMSVAALFVMVVLVLLSLRNGFKLEKIPLWKHVLTYLGLLIYIPRLVYFLSDFMYRTSMSIMAFPFMRIFGEDFNFSIRDFIDQFL